MKVTKAQLKQIIKEELQEGLGDWIKKMVGGADAPQPRATTYDLLKKELEEKIYQASARNAMTFENPKTMEQKHAKSDVLKLLGEYADHIDRTGGDLKLSPAFFKKARNIFGPTLSA